MAVAGTIGKFISVTGGIPGINSGKGSYSAITKTVFIKLKNGTIKKMGKVSCKTQAKIAVSRCSEGALISGTALGNMVNKAIGDSKDNAKEISKDILKDLEK